jgi:hypothetical protein
MSNCEITIGITSSCATKDFDYEVARMREISRRVEAAIVTPLGNRKERRKQESINKKLAAYKRKLDARATSKS